MNIPAEGNYLSTMARMPGSRLTFRRSEKVVGGLEIIGYYPDQPMSSLFPNHSETLYTKDLEDLELKAVEAKIRMTPPAASGSTEATDSIHVYLLDGVKNIAYDISVDPSYVDEDTPLSIAKSFKLKSPYSANEPAGASSSVEASDLVLSTNHLDINVNGGTVQGILTLRMIKGMINNSTDPGPFMGKTMEGSYLLELSDNSGKQISSFDLNSAFSGENLAFKDNFDISFEDYNGDGCMDFTIGQYASSNGYTYVIFSIDKQGRITRLPIKDKNELFSDNMGYSPKLARAGDSSFILQYYDNSKGKRFESTYKWDNGQFVMVGEKEI
jgi:bla regulator protein BlaR1